MQTITDLPVVRALPASMELRAAESSDVIGTLEGHFSRFNTWYRIASFWEGEFMERVAPGAFAQTIAEDRAGMKVEFNHGMDPQIGDKVLGPIVDLREDKVGAAYRVDLLDTSFNRDLLPGLRAGLYGSSFQFRVTGESWVDAPDPSETNPKGLPERTITAARVMEFGPVTFPANPAAEAGARSLTDEWYDHLRTRSPERFEQMRSMILRGPAGRPDARSTGGGVNGGETGATAPTPSDRARDNRLRLIQTGVIK